MGLFTTPAAICCASLTITPANEAPGTTIKKMPSSTTSAAATGGLMRRASQRCTGAKITYSTGIPIRPVA